MAACPNCGRDNRERFRFCGFCGTLLVAEGDEIRKTVTVLFSDVTGSTSLGERLDPESVRRVMLRYFDVARRVLERHGGTVEKFIGDAVMAVFGVPAVHEDDALRAARAAVELREGVAGLNDQLEGTLDARLQIRIGINSGDVVAGDPSARQAFVSGDAVNVAARLEQAAEPGEILIGAETLRLARDAVRVEPVPIPSLKGKTEPVLVFRLVEIVPGAPAFARRLDSPMVGRDAELRQLLDTADRAAKEAVCELVTVLGEAGVGKSRLTLELLSRLADRARILEGRCLPYGEGITYWPVAEMVKQAAGIDESDSPPEALAKLGRLFEGSQADDAALICDRVGAAIGLREAEVAIQETFWAIRRLFESLAAEQLLVMVFDDINWAEPTLLDLIDYIAGFSRGQAVLLLCTARPELRETRPDWGRAGTLLELTPLDAKESERLLENLLGQTRLPAEVRTRIVDTAEGNPLFVEEMLRMLIDEDVLQRNEGYWVPTGDLSLVSAPRSIEALITARLDRLLEQERAVIQRASVVGKVFYWGAVTDLSPEEVRTGVGGHLQALQRKELIQPESSPFAGEDAFRFSHILVRDAAYESTPKRTRAHLHELFASWLEHVAGDRLAEYEEIVGYHLEQAHRYLAELGPLDGDGRALAVRAAEYLGSAGRRSYHRGDMPAAAHLLSRAASLLPSRDPARLEFLPLLGAALTDTGAWDRADAVLNEAMALARNSGDQELEARTLMPLLSLDLQRNRYATDAEGLPVLERAIALFEDTNDEAGLAEAWRLYGTIQFWLGRAALGAEAIERSIDHARRAGDHRAEVDSLRWLALTILRGPTPAAEGSDRLQKMVEQPGADPILQFTAIGLRSELEAELSHLDLARDLVSRAKAMAQDLGLEAGGVLRSSGWVEMMAGEPRRAEAEFREAVELFRAMGDIGHLAGVAPGLASALLEQGRDEEALLLADDAARIAAGDDSDSQIEWRRVRAKILARRGQLDEAVRLASEAADVGRSTDFLDHTGRAVMDLAVVLQLAGRPTESADAAREAVSVFERKGNLVMAERARGLIGNSI